MLILQCVVLCLQAIDLFNDNQVKLFALKPCCLPQMLYAKRGDIFKIGRHEFAAKDVCSNGTFNRKDWTGPPRWHLQARDVLRFDIAAGYSFSSSNSHTFQPKFDVWADNLFRGISLENDDTLSDHFTERIDGCRVLVSSNGGTKVKNEITIQVDGGKF